MASIESVNLRASKRMAESTVDQRRVLSKIRQGCPLDAEDDTKRKLAYIRRVVGVGSDVAARIAANEDPGRLPLSPSQASKAESLQGKTVDFVPLRRFLDLAVTASRSVARIIFSDGSPEGTGFLVAPGVLLTNSHVIPSPEAASDMLAEFTYELDGAGRPAVVSRFRLNPEIFVSDPEDDLDFTLIGVGGAISGSDDLASFGYLPLIDSDDKHIKAAFVNVVQHPSGGLKQLVLRENRILHRGATVLIYGADTLKGSSGSPVFNDEWEVVALHHWGSPYRAHKDDDPDVPESGNEGVRISSIVRHLKSELPSLRGAQRDAALAAINSGTRRPSMPIRNRDLSEEREETAVSRTEGAGAVAGNAVLKLAPDGTVTWTIPLGSVRPAGATVPQISERAALESQESAAKVFKPDPDYSNRRGYNKSFLGTVVSFPTMSAKLKAAAAPVDGDTGIELKYQHFSVVMHRERRLAIFTAVNIDGASVVKINRKTGKVTSVETDDEAAEAYEKWYDDDRAGDAATDQSLYDHPKMSRFQRGHLVKRTDPSWGTVDKAIRGQADTFHFPNCAPQHQKFNPIKSRWAGVEDWITNGSDDEDVRVTVFCGPLFEDDDPEIAGVQVPRAFWKVVARVEDGQLLASGIIADQSELIGGGEGLEDAEAFPDFPETLPEEYQVAISDIEKRTGLKFGSLRQHDTLKDGESVGKPTPVADFEDLVLGGSLDRPERRNRARKEAREALSTVHRTKAAVRRWAGLPPDARVLLADQLESLRQGAKNALLVEVNGEFQGERDFPISADEWDQLSPKIVGDVNTECQKRV